MGDMGLQNTGAASSLQDLLRQRIIDKINADAVARHNMESDRNFGMQQQQMDFAHQQRTDALNETARQHDLNAANQTEDNNRALNEQIPAGTFFEDAPAQQKIVGRLQSVGGATMEPNQQERPAVDVGPLQAGDDGGAKKRGYLKLASAKQGEYADTAAAKVKAAGDADAAKVEAARLATEAKAEAARAAFENRTHEDEQRQKDRLAQIAAAGAARPVKPEKPNTINLSQGGKSAKAAIEQAAPLTDRVMEMIRQEAPDIETNPQKYNGVMAKGHSILQTMKYKAGFADDTDPRQQLVSLLQPIQAGQYTRSSRSRQMLDLALKHMADPSQTLLTQYQRAKELKAIMPEMLEGIVRGEQPVDPSNPLGGSYLDPNKGGGGAPTAGGGTVEKWGRDASGRLVKQ